MQLEIGCPFPGRILFTGLKNYFCSLAKCKDLHQSPVSHYFSLNFLFVLIQDLFLGGNRFQVVCVTHQVCLFIIGLQDILS